MLGRTIAHYEILERLGAGGMGEVYKARDTRLLRTVALKFLPSQLTNDDEAKARFVREAQAASALDHPNVCTVYQVDEDEDGTCFVAMAYCEGSPLSDTIRSGPLPLDRSVDIAMQIASGLKKAHENGIVHRDIKPGNIIISKDGVVKIIDFGLATLRGRTKITKELTTLGTVGYMSPEQSRGQAVDHLTDLWSLGCVMYEMLTGLPPFRADYEQAIVYAILNTPPDPIRKMRPKIPPELERIVQKCLEKDPAKRYQSAADLIEALGVIRPGLDEHVPVTAPLMTRLGRKGWKYVLSAALVIAGVAALLVLKPLSTEVEQKRKSVAVLPFLNLMGGKEDDYFSDGITDDILTQLCKIGDLKVISRTTMKQYKNTAKSVREIGEELEAGVVLEGSVRRAGDRIRIVAQLIDVQTDDHLWAETYDRSIKDVFAVQSEIAQKIAIALHAKLSPAERERLVALPGSNVEAYNLVLEGSYYLARGSREDVDQGISKFRQAISMDPNNARAWANLATAFARQADLGAMSTEEGYTKAREAAQKALAFDDQLAQAHTIMGWIKRSYDWDWRGAEVECRKALELAPGDVNVIRNMANLNKSLGQFDEAITLMKKAAGLDPKRPPIYTSLGLLSMYANRLDESAEAYRKAIQLNQEYPIAHTFLGLVYLLQGNAEKAIAEILAEQDEGWRLYGLAQAYQGAGRKAEADSALNELIVKYGDESTYQVAQAYAYRGEADSAFQWLEKAYSARDGGLSEFKGDPFMRNIVKDPRYIAFMKKMRLPI